MSDQVGCSCHLTGRDVEAMTGPQRALASEDMDRSALRAVRAA